MLTADFDYDLPDALIAQTPAEPRDSCRLLVLHMHSGKIEHRKFTDILEYLRPQDLLVANNTKVMPSRLLGHKTDTNGKVELLLLRQLSGDRWEALVKPGKRLKPGAEIQLDGLKASIIGWGDSQNRGVREIRLSSTTSLDINQSLHKIGELPLPPYITNYLGDRELYQTVYSELENSAAAPTAGLHFTKQLLQDIITSGTGFTTVCLEVGLDTFRKVQEVNIEDHQIHSEKYSVSSQVFASIATARQNGGKVIAVGTTSVRALESAYNSDDGTLVPQDRQSTSLYITPGYRFRVIDALLTNFHTPKSTLMMMVSALAGRQNIMAAYAEAVKNNYRFLSFGDAMLII